MASYQVKLNFNDGSYSYDLPLVSEVSDPAPSIKATVIEGNRGNGAIVIPGGQKSIRITVKGVLFDETGFAGLETKIEEMKTKVTTNPATLTLKYWTGTLWQNIWAYTVRRIDEISFPQSYRLDAQDYSIEFLVITY